MELSQLFLSLRLLTLTFLSITPLSSSRTVNSKKSSVPVSPTPSHFKSPCNSSLPCAPSKLLTCQDSLCHCIFPDSMKYSELKGHCVSLVDEPCGQMLMDSLEEDPVLLECVPGAQCNSQGFCECLQSYFRTESGTCTKQKDFGSPCTLHKECLKPLGLQCINRTCTCDPKVSIDSLKFLEPHNPEHLCLGLASKPCPSGQCIPYADCVTSDPPQGSPSTSTCVCKPGYAQSELGLCLGTFNKSCDVQMNLKCQRDFTCLNGICQCKHPRDQIYHRKTNQCVSLVGGPCLHPSSLNYNKTFSNANGLREQLCIENAICKKVTKERTLCGCATGYVENVKRSCDIAYGHPCSSEDKDKDSDKSYCDRLANLKCRDGVCLCPDDGQIFDKSKQKCVALVGATCNRMGSDECVVNSVCITRRNGLLPQGLCQCKDDFEETEGRTCNCKFCSAPEDNNY